jgi:hypothetical protein
MLDNPTPPDKFNFTLSKAMKLYKSIFHSAIISASIVAASLPVRAAIVTYTDRDAVTIQGSVRTAAQMHA